MQNEEWVRTRNYVLEDFFLVTQRSARLSQNRRSSWRREEKREKEQWPVDHHFERSISVPQSSVLRQQRHVISPERHRHHHSTQMWQNQSPRRREWSINDSGQRVHSSSLHYLRSSFVENNFGINYLSELLEERKAMAHIAWSALARFDDPLPQTSLSNHRHEIEMEYLIRVNAFVLLLSSTTRRMNHSGWLDSSIEANRRRGSTTNDANSRPTNISIASLRFHSATTMDYCSLLLANGMSNQLWESCLTPNWTCSSMRMHMTEID